MKQINFRFSHNHRFIEKIVFLPLVIIRQIVFPKTSLHNWHDNFKQAILILMLKYEKTKEHPNQLWTNLWAVCWKNNGWFVFKILNYHRCGWKKVTALSEKSLLSYLLLLWHAQGAVLNLLFFTSLCGVWPGVPVVSGKLSAFKPLNYRRTLISRSIDIPERTNNLNYKLTGFT